ncbi:putative monovalent cation/H+ antiporter subunit A [Chlorobium phaeovibrioides]|uniref:Monovalent cation/H+ antiporter subunit A n=1 Tax=Chlorobium phaeovibrioides TaxID=1094 RepID=A0ABW9UN97_CHLPH|nr:putative monovalent cation/H+ antiporter subunit A [Chlorobium phaeovibrioides]MWV54553.1 putative monovalent cation/H+ antiporter subunit A [Chlorobium phaeovibrioides]QEQ56690.1 putative monovalent cation/H+ antiporter subunit A [Chlorobium phaeovibrioides]
MLGLIATGFLASAIAPVLYKRYRENFGWIAVLFPLYMFFGFLSRYPEIAAGNSVRESLPWVPSLGINFSFLLDGLSLTFALIISLVGAAVFLFAGAYMKGYRDAGRFYLYIGVFMTSMLGLVLADNMLLLFVFWELTSFSSYLLIGFNHHKESSRKSALQALLVTGGGGLALLAGILLLGSVTGTYEISSFYDMNRIITSSALYPAIVVLLLLGAFTKSAQFPFHFWLPNAMEAPTPVSAYLHSATMVKAGIYLIARLNHEIGGTPLWQDTVLITGAVTMLFTATLAFRQTDLKKLLAYSTLSVLGTLVMLLGIGSELAIKAFFIYLIAHSLYKGTLFLVAGTIDHETGTRDVSKLAGLRKAMPVTAAAAALASFSMMGVIPLIGFIGKETVYKAILELDRWGLPLIGAAVLANACVVMVTLLVGFRPFLGKAKETPRQAHEAPLKMLLGPSLLAVLGLLIGLFPDFFISAMLEQSARNILSEELSLKIVLWHGFNLVLILSFVTLLLGGLFYALRPVVLRYSFFSSLPALFKPSSWYESALKGMLSFAKLQTLILQNGYLRNYTIVIILAALIPASFALYRAAEEVSIIPDYSITFYEAALGLIIIISTGLLITSTSRLKSIVSLGVMGFSIGIIFVIYGAPDVALTTFAIETLNVILFVLVLQKLPKFLKLSRSSNRIRDAVIASGIGVFMTLVVLFATSFNISTELKEYFAAASLPEGKGLNVVNVILVDFRALDTLGEITVLTIAAIGVLAMLKTATGRKAQP